MKLRSLACHSPTAVWPGYKQAMDWYQFMAWGLGTPSLMYYPDSSYGDAYFHISSPQNQVFWPQPKSIGKSPLSQIRTKKEFPPFPQRLQYSGSCYSCGTPTYCHFPTCTPAAQNGVFRRRVSDGKVTGEGRENEYQSLLKENQTLPCPHPCSTLVAP